MALWWTTLTLLLWKCFLKCKRNPVTTIIDFAFPVTFLSLFFIDDKSEVSVSENVIEIFPKQSIFNPLHYGGFHLAYTPSNGLTDEVMRNVNKTLNEEGNTTQVVTLMALRTEVEIEQWLQNNSRKGNYTAPSIGVVYLETDTNNNQFTYKLRTNAMERDPGKLDNHIFSPQYSCDEFLHYKFYAIVTQSLIDREMLRIAGVDVKENIQSGFLPVLKRGSPNYTYKNMYYLMLYLATLFLSNCLIRDIIREKSNGFKELLKVLGVQSYLIWIHWLVYAIILFLPTAFVLTVFSLRSFKVNLVIVIILLFMYCINTSVIVFALSCLFTNEKIARAMLVFLLSFLMAIAMGVDKLLEKSFSVRAYRYFNLFICLLPMCNICWTLDSLDSVNGNYERWYLSPIFSGGLYEIQISIELSLLLSVVSTVFFILIIYYLDTVFPGPFGVSKPFTFVCNYFWSLCKAKNAENVSARCLPEDFEKPGNNAEVVLGIRDLGKDFSKNKRALDGVNFDGYRGEIMVLLGQNGSGKTTILSVITGMISATRGHVLYEGRDTVNAINHLRSHLGYCPQTSWYFPKITVIEHIIFVGMIKGLSYSKAKTEGCNILNGLRLEEKKNKLISTLGEATRRRLCLALALIGDSQVLILDEPTSGLDPLARRRAWNMISSKREGRTILLATNSAEEADALGDRILMLDRGHVLCCGTTMFLKRLHGDGFRFRLQTQTNAPIKYISNLVKIHSVKAEIKEISDIQVDLIIREDFKETLPNLFAKLDEDKAALEICKISVTCSSLQDVFINVLNVKGDKSQHANSSYSIHSTASHTFNETQVNYVSFSQCLNIFILKRVIRFKRKYGNYMIFLLFSIVLIVLELSTLTINELKDSAEDYNNPILLNLSLYPRSIIFLTHDEKNRNLANQASNMLYSNPGHLRVRTIRNFSNFDRHLENLAKNGDPDYEHNTLFSLSFINNSITARYFCNTYEKNHASALALNFISNLLIKNSTKHGNITVLDHPYMTDNICSSDSWRIDTILVTWLFTVMGIFPVALASIVAFITEERVSGFKHLQAMAGISPLFYWFVNLLIDSCVLFCISGIVLATNLFFGPEILKQPVELLGVFVLVLVILPACLLPFAYLFSYLVQDEDSVYLFSIVTIFCGIIPAVLYYNIHEKLHDISEEARVTFFTFLNVLFGWNPIFYSTLSLEVAVKAGFVCRICHDRCQEEIESVTNVPFNEFTFYLTMLVLVGVFYFILLCIIEYGVCKRIVARFTYKEVDSHLTTNVEGDVSEETKRVRGINMVNLEVPFRVEGLEKKYRFGPKAVDGVHFNLYEGECLGILGSNEAGKSTIMQMLSAVTFPDRGDAFVNGLSLTRDRRLYTRPIGYCPQTDAVIHSYTGEEVLRLLAKIRGIPKKDIDNEVWKWLEKTGIAEHGRRRCGLYTRGMTRKLSVAMAAIGGPRVVLLDEPTNGVDPVSRRTLWAAIQELLRGGACVVLTSHDMEECEALCSRLTILEAGRIRCIGSVDYLKSKYGQGLFIFVKLKDPTSERLQALKRELIAVFPESSIVDERWSLIKLKVLDVQTPHSIASLFSKMMRIKEAHDVVEDFSISETTLEDVFLSVVDTGND